MYLCMSNHQKNPRVHNIFVRNSGAGNGCAQFYGHLEKCVRSAGKTMSIKFLVLGGGYFGFFFGGRGSADFIFMGARIFLKPGDILSQLRVPNCATTNTRAVDSQEGKAFVSTSGLIIYEDPILTPEFLTKDFPSATRSRMDTLTKENLLSGQKLLPLQFPELSLP